MKHHSLAALAGLAGLTLAALTPAAIAAPAACDRGCMAGMVRDVLGSMVAHKPEMIALAPVYRASENSHPAALGMMQAWRTITKAGEPSLMAIDTAAGQAYFALVVSEGGDASVLWGRLKMVDRKVAEVEIFINRARGDHGFSFSPEQLAGNYARIMAPPANRTKASHEQLMALARAAFNADDPLKVDIDANCQFTELGWKVIDPGLDDVPPNPPPPGMSPDPNRPLGCVFPPYRPTDHEARIIALDDELGLVVVAGVVPGHVYPYPHFGHMMSAFIPDQMKEPGQAQAAWFARHVKQGKAPVVAPAPATGETMQVLQLYNGKLQVSQINVALSGPGLHTIWTLPSGATAP